LFYYNEQLEKEYENKETRIYFLIPLEESKIVKEKK